MLCSFSWSWLPELGRLEMHFVDLCKKVFSFLSCKEILEIDLFLYPASNGNVEIQYMYVTASIDIPGGLSWRNR